MNSRRVYQGQPNAHSFAFVPSRERGEKGGQIFNAHPLDVFGGASQVIKQGGRPSVAMNFKTCYVVILHALRAEF